MAGAGSSDGDATGVASLGREYGAMARSADLQGSRIRAAANAIPAATFTCAGGDRMRAYVDRMQAASATMAKAYDRVASAAPGVARAIADATKAKTARDAAQKAEKAAQAAVDKAQADLAAARAAVAAADAVKAVGSLVGLHAGGATPAQHAAVAAAEKVLASAQHKLTDAQTALTKAVGTYNDAEEERQRVTRTFATLCRDQADIAKRALPEAPEAPEPEAVHTVTGLVSGLGMLASVGLTQGKSISAFVAGRAAEGSSALSAAEAWSKRLERVDGGIAFVVPAVVSTIEAFSDKHLTSQQRTRLITSHTVDEGGATYGGAASAAKLCRSTGVAIEATPLCGLAGGVAGSLFGADLGKIPIVNDFNNFVSDNVTTPLVKGPGELVHGKILRGTIDTLASPADVVVNVGKPLVGVLDEVGDALPDPPDPLDLFK